MPDPWIVDGKLHPAAEPLLEWRDDEIRYRLCLGPKAVWQVEWFSGLDNQWYEREGYIVAHEAAALLEMAAQEWLLERHMTVAPQWSPAIRKEPFWIVYNAAGQPLLVETGYTEWNNHKYTKFDTYTAALQAGILATAKGDDDE